MLMPENMVGMNCGVCGKCEPLNDWKQDDLFKCPNCLSEFKPYSTLKEIPKGWFRMGNCIIKEECDLFPPKAWLKESRI